MAYEQNWNPKNKMPEDEAIAPPLINAADVAQDEEEELPATAAFAEPLSMEDEAAAAAAAAATRVFSCHCSYNLFVAAARA